MTSIMFRVSETNSILDILYAPALGADRDSWVFLIKRVSRLLLSSVSKHPWCAIHLLMYLE